MLERLSGAKLIDLSKIREDIKKSKGTEEEPNEDPVNDDEVLYALYQTINTDKKSGIIS